MSVPEELPCSGSDGVTLMDDPLKTVKRPRHVTGARARACVRAGGLPSGFTATAGQLERAMLAGARK
ncbi:hypothetical protein chiPu_0018602 [Chiloscyllium punctatum]|uniref:Uncharacterized protein n=1 Tax=Chiloscyllium punctatum TaxID=137246 RepID=A0A401RNY0_CHIPU|nr:hypothetical protein [Chiloscyllium punctatum]